MVTRRQTLKAVVSSILATGFDNFGFAQESGELDRATAAACTSCVNVGRAKLSFSNILDSAPLIKNVSLPRVLNPMSRSSRAGIPVNYVESSTGRLVFSITDLVLHGMPPIRLTGYITAKISRTPDWDEVGQAITMITYCPLKTGSRCIPLAAT